MHPDDSLHVILDALDALLLDIDEGHRPWQAYEASFGGTEDAPEALRRDAYLAALADADRAITARLNVSAGL